MEKTTNIKPALAKSGALALLPSAGPTYGALAALILLVMVNVVATPNFASAGNLWNILLQVSTTTVSSPWG
ncbi:MAG: hypothetical protein WKF84_23335 [Pyrinomonadaceae bacterium]